ncbi:MAG: NAD(P)-dependent oxidoreductase [Desulfotomaculaceae bacterium]|nr:NAD(P)-dependent oxidoreductase [Desulfotomaculaceae bacterium]
MPTTVSLVPRDRFFKTNIDIPEGWNFIFLENFNEEDIIKACRGADFLLALSGFSPAQISAFVIENSPSIKMIQMDGVGYDTVDADAAAKHLLPVANNAGKNAGSVAELAIGMIVSLQRHVLVSDREIKAGNYAQLRGQLIKTGLADICDAKLGLVGLGAIGRKVAEVAGMLGAKLYYYDIYRAAENTEVELGVQYKPLDELLTECEIISMHVPLTEQTRGMINRREFGLMRPGTIFINTARGEVVDQMALAEFLENGHLGGAAIDTMSPEPPPPSHPLLNLSPTAQKKLLITPHLAGVTTGAFRRMLLNALDNMACVAKGKAPKYVVNGVTAARHLQS